MRYTLEYNIAGEGCSGHGSCSFEAENDGEAVPRAKNISNERRTILKEINSNIDIIPLRLIKAGVDIEITLSKPKHSYR